MIPKILHFIWFGNYIPSFVNFAINNFKNINSDFYIHFIYKTINEIESLIDGISPINNLDDYLLKKCGQAILNNNSYYKNTINHCKKINLKFIQILADIYRLELLNFYGGIYLDCDTFPIKPFDNKLLLNKSFIVVRHFNNNFIINDNYFIGSQKNNNIDHILWEIYDISKTKDIFKILLTPKNWQKNITFLINKKKFFECKLQYGDFSFSKDFYIEHYNAMSWKNNNFKIYTPLCKYDK